MSRRSYDPDLYDALAQGLPGDVDFFLDLARESASSGHPVLELACGTGRVSIPIARAGVSVVGLDASPAMLERAREKSAELSNIRFVEGNMAAFSLPERFDLVIIPFRSFQHLLTVADQLACLRCIHEHLVPGGRLVINVFNPNIPMMAEWFGSKRGTIQPRRDDYTHPRTGRLTRAWETREYRTAAQEVDNTFIDEELSDEGAVISTVHSGYKLRYVWRYEMEHMFARSGFQIEALYGDFARSPFDDDSPEMVWLVRKPA
jgi:SAM-dependent methyltransferase